MGGDIRYQQDEPRFTPFGWALPVTIAILMLGSTGWFAPPAQGLSSELEDSIHDLEVTPTAYQPLQPPVTQVSELQKGCVPEVLAVPLATAVVELEIIAPCDPGVAVRVSHEGLSIGAILDDVGRSVVTLPTLRKEAIYRIEVEGREVIATDGTALDFAAYDRTVLLADPDTGFALHAYEGDAEFGDAGHVQPGQPYDPIRALVGAGGFLAKIGTPSLTGSKVAQVYTAPRSTDTHLLLEAEVTETNCGRSIRAVTIQPDPDGPPAETPWELQMPPCDALGEIVLLGKISR